MNQPLHCDIAILFCRFNFYALIFEMIVCTNIWKLKTRTLNSQSLICCRYLCSEIKIPKTQNIPATLSEKVQDTNCNKNDSQFSKTMEETKKMLQTVVHNLNEKINKIINTNPSTSDVPEDWSGKLARW